MASENGGIEFIQDGGSVGVRCRMTFAPAAFEISAFSRTAGAASDSSGMIETNFKTWNGNVWLAEIVLSRIRKITFGDNQARRQFISEGD